MSKAIAILACLLALPLAHAQVPPPPGASFFSPQQSPDGSRWLWENLERGGSIWSTDADGGHPRLLVAGHSPSWVDRTRFRFVVSKDDGHQLLDQALLEHDLETGATALVQSGSDNPDYHTVVHQPGPQRAPGAELASIAGKIVCVDPGHGKSSGSGSPITGKKEDEYVLIMSYLVRDYLDAAGAIVKMTRFDNSTLPALPARVNFSNAVSAAAFNAVHLNFSVKPEPHGLEVFCRTKDTVSRAQATKIHDAMIAATGIFSRGVKYDKESLGFTLAVLSENHATHNKSLSEGCFLSNADDVARLEKTHTMDQFAWGIYAGLSRTLGSEPAPIATTAVVAVTESFPPAPGRFDRSRPNATPSSLNWSRPNATPSSLNWIGGALTPSAMETPEGDGAAGTFAAPASGWRTLRAGGPAWADYELAATMRRTAGNGRYGLVARSNQAAADGDHLVGYLLLVDEESGMVTLSLSTGRPADALPLASAALPERRADAPWRTLSLECRGTTIRGIVDGVVVGTPVPPSDPPPGDEKRDGAEPDVLRDGRYGMIAIGDAETAVAVDRLRISE